jgi:hypothetical protein
MKRLLLLALAACLSASMTQGQVQLRLTIEQEQFLPGEILTVTARISNFSGRPLRLGGKGNEWLRFGVESLDGGVVPRLSEVPVDLDLELESASRASFRVNLQPHFELTRPGRYRVTAVMELPNANVTITSPALSFDIISGSTLWSQEFGVPPELGKEGGDRPDHRKYLLQQANYTKQLRLYLRVTESGENRTLHVIPLGQMVSFNKPEPRVDREGRLHLLHQDSAHAYAYHLILPDGSLMARRTYDISGTRPKLRVNEDGEVIVVGGVRRVTSADLPKPSNAAETPTTPTTKDDLPKANKS